MSKKYEMIIFDIDGTLCDTVDIAYESINIVLEKYNINRKVKFNDILSGQGLNRENYAKNCMGFLDKELREKILEEANILKYQKIKENDIKVYDNVKKTISELSKNYLISIVSNCGKGYIELLLPKMNIKKYVKDYIAASLFNMTKQEAIQEILKRNNIKKAIYVGDTLLDKESALKAGVDFIYAEYGFGNLNNEKNTIKEINDLIEVINNLEKR